MMKKLATIAIATALSFNGLLLTTGPVHAGAVEVFKCKMVDGKSMDDLVAVGNAFLDVTAGAGIEDYKISFLAPLFSHDISRGTFYWVGYAENMATIGAVNDLWETDANADVRAQWMAAASDCEASRAHYSVDVE